MNKYALICLEKAMNNYLHLDKEVDRLLNPLINKIIVLNISSPSLTLIMKFHHDHIQLVEDLVPEANCCLEGSASDLFLLTKSNNPALSFFSSAVKISGETDTATHFGNLFTHLNIDWEEYLSKIVGDTVAYTVGNFVSNALSWGRLSVSQLTNNLTEYLQEEVRQFPPRQELSYFLDDVDDLRHDLSRLEARINRMIKSKE